MYQFMRTTWHEVGGRGDPARASVAEQTKRAIMLHARYGWAPWRASAACHHLR